MSSQWDFTVKSMRGQSYLYIQRVLGKGKTRKVQSYSLGNVSEMSEIYSNMMSTNESLFLGELLLYYLFEKLSLNKKISKSFNQMGASRKDIDYLLFLASMRVVHPLSKDALARYFSHSTFTILRPSPHVNELYQTMDYITNPESWFRELAQKCLTALDYSYDAVYYDTSTIHFFSNLDDLRKKGFGKGVKKGLPLVKVELACTEDYFPLSYSIQPGNVSDISCFKKFLEKDWEKIKKDQTLLTFDSGCYSFDLITDLDQKLIPYLANADITKYTTQESPKIELINQKEWQIQEGLYSGHRVIIAFNRENHESAKEKINKNIHRVMTANEDIKGHDIKKKIDKINSLIKSLGLKKVIVIEETKNSYNLILNQEQLAKKKNKAKKMVLMTNQNWSAKDCLSRYLRRGEVERVYHYLKTPIPSRPVNHWKKNRIHAHFFLVMLGYLQVTTLRLYLEKHYSLKLTLDQILEELRFSIATKITPREGTFILSAGKQVSWIKDLIKDLNLPLREGVFKPTILRDD